MVLGLLLILELVSDCIPALASCQDCAMLVAKPVLSFTMALAPSYGTRGASRVTQHVATHELDRGVSGFGNVSADF